MHIHNFYSDILLSVRALFDNKIFPSNLIKNYEFNIANRAFTLSKKDYKPSFSFPTCLISLNDEQYTFGERCNVTQKLMVENDNQIPILYDPATETTLYLQEEHEQITMSVQLNCESQLQAKELEFYIKRYLPIGKYIQVHDFTSFLEIQPIALQTLGMDYNRREIINLFTRLNKNLGQVEYCFSVNYKPLIKLDNSSVSLGDSTSRSFIVNLDLLYQIQVPMWLVWDQQFNKIIKINIDFSRIGTDPISQNSCRPLFIRSDSPDNVLNVLLNLVIPSIDDWWSGICESGNEYDIILQRYIDLDLINKCDIQKNNMNNNNFKYLNDNKIIGTNLSYLKSPILVDLLQSNILSFTDFLYAISFPEKTNLNNHFQDIYNLGEIIDDDISNFIKSFISLYPLLDNDLLLGNISYSDLYEYLSHKTTKNAFLQYHLDNNLNTLFLEKLFNNEITINDLYDYYITEKPSDVLNNLFDLNIISKSNILSILSSIGIIPTTIKKPVTLFTVHFDENFFKFSSSNIYKLQDTSGDIKTIIPFFTDLNMNTIYFQITYNDLETKYSPTITTPLILQIAERISCV